MTPETTIKYLADALETLPEFSEDDAYARMKAAGIPDRDADRAYKFMQIACGRLLLAGIVGRFADGYFWLNASGDTVETGRIQDEPFFAAAAALLRERKGPWVARLGAMSADVASINELLRRGSKPGNLQTSPAVLFLEQPSQVGMEKANQLIERYFRASSPVARKPWWRFWR